ncbi:MAG: allophanate hydrolase subunit 1 [Aeromicrobium sp.]
MRLLPCGDRAVLLDCESLTEARRWHTALAGEHAGHIVLGARTVLVHGDPSRIRDLVSRTSPADELVDATTAREVEIPVIYDGPDLDEVARQTGLTSAQVVAAHTGTPWVAAFGGFAPGFSYLVDGDPRLNVTRRSTPRTAVPTGSVGLAGEFSGVYPRASPGGWQLVGHTDLPTWDTTRDPAALLLPGTVVRFREAT